MDAFLVLIALLAIVWLWYRVIYRPGKYRTTGYHKRGSGGSYITDDDDNSSWSIFSSDSDSDGDGDGGGDD